MAKCFTLHLNTVSWLIGLLDRRKLYYFFISVSTRSKTFPTWKYSLIHVLVVALFKDNKQVDFEDCVLKHFVIQYLVLNCTCISPTIHKHMLSIQKCMKRFYQQFCTLMTGSITRTVTYFLSCPFIIYSNMEAIFKRSF